jgi:hypothetical protein
METVSFSTQLTEKEYIQTFWIYVFTRKKFWLSMGWYFLLIGLVFGFFASDRFILALPVVLAWIILYLSYRYYIFRKDLSGEKRLLEKIEWITTSDTLLGKGGTFEIRLPVNELFLVEETRKFFFVWATKAGYTLLPKKSIPVSVQEILRTAMRKKYSNK